MFNKERTKNAQFIIISLRNNMFELCDRLFGIYKVKNCTSATYIAPELIELDEKKKKPNKQQQQQQQANKANTTQAVLGLASQSLTNENINTEGTETQQTATSNEKCDVINTSLNDSASNRTLVN